MPTHDLTISADQFVGDYTQDIQSGLVALASNSSNNADPPTTQPCQFSARTDSLQLRIRNTANTAWVVVGALDQPNLGLATSANLTLHTNASAAVHGLPASTHVLGNRNAAGEFIQRGSATSAALAGIAIAIQSYRDWNINLPNAFSSASSYRVACWVTGGWGFAQVLSQSASSFTVRVFDVSTAATSAARTVDYVAIGS